MTSREEFEAWYEQSGLKELYSYKIETAWQGWQAAKASNTNLTESSCLRQKMAADTARIEALTEALEKAIEAFRIGSTHNAMKYVAEARAALSVGEGRTLPEVSSLSTSGEDAGVRVTQEVEKNG